MNQNGATKLLPDPNPTLQSGRDEEREPTDAERWRMQRELQDEVDRVRDEARRQQWKNYLSSLASASAGKGQMPLGLKKTLTLGYVTGDLCPGKGDDIEHIPGEQATNTNEKPKLTLLQSPMKGSSRPSSICQTEGKSS